MLNKKNVLVRALSGTIYVAVIVLSLLFRIWSISLFPILCVIMAVWATSEFYALWKSKDRKELNYNDLSLDIFGVVSLLSSLICLTCFNEIFSFTIRILMFLVPTIFFIGYILARMIYAIYSDSSDSVESLSKAFMGQLYIGCGLMSAIYLSAISPGFVLLAFIYIWLNDTGAFLVGSMIGKHKMFPRLSPKKSWEGFIGGVAVCCVIAAIFWLTHFDILLIGSQYKYFGYPLTVFLIPIIVCLFATVGDLFESMLKRRAGVKDSGNLIPGHGGLLDRIDSMLFVMPGLIVFVFLFNLI